VRQDLLRLLTNRLQIERDRRLHPDIAGGEVRSPVFVTGLPRTGTTLLHGLLAADPEARAPLAWETMFPSPPPARAGRQSDRRIGWAERQIRWFQRLNPSFQRIHALGARLPEECLVITSHSFLSFQFQTMYRVPAYQTWLEAEDLRPCYAEHRAFLQHLQWRYPAPRWVLKAPAHLYGIDALFATYPDATVVFTHREPLEVVPSVASLHATLRATFSDADEPAAVGAEVTRRWAEGLRRALAVRDAGHISADRFVDVHYTALVRDPIGTVRDICARIGQPVTRAAEERRRRYLAEHPKDKYGRHDYSLARFGLDAEVERERYRFYRERFLL
jgi:hypothetical protein